MSAIEPEVSQLPGADRRGGELSFAQERLWFLQRLEPHSAAYNVVAARRLSGPLNVAALQRALGEIVRRHDTLRTTFDERGGAPVQTIAPFSGFVLPLRDLSAWAREARDAEVQRLITEEAGRPFDLACGPLFRAVLLRVEADEHVLVLSMHHIVTDGWSLGVLFRELAAHYAAALEDRLAPLPELAVRYADYAVWQRAQLQGEAHARQLDYWTRRLAGIPDLLALPTDYPRPARQSHDGARELVTVPAALVDALRALARSEDATLYMVLLGAFQLLISRYAGSEDIVIGSPISGRARSEFEGIIGCFVNTLVLRTDLSGDPTVRELMRRVRRTTLDAYDHQQLPFERLVASLQPERALSHAPLVQTFFNLYSRKEPGLAGLRVDEVTVGYETSKFDLAMNCSLAGRSLIGGLSYRTDLFARRTIQQMLGHFVQLLSSLASNPDARLSQLEWLDDEERRQVCDLWNRTDAPVANEAYAHQRFQAWARRTPHAIAVDSEDGRLTYGELNTRANHLAHRLRRLGVVPDARIAICLERGPGTIVAMLAVLKAGGAYVPLDASVPAARLRSLVEDAGAMALVTQDSLRTRLIEAGIALPIVTVDGEVDARSEALPAALPPASGPASAPAPAHDPDDRIVGPEQLAYVIYTSGSTGVPSGVLVSHGALRNYIDAVTSRLELEEGWSFALVSTFAADLGHTAIFPALTTGGTLQIVPQAAVFDPVRLAEWFAPRPADVLKIVPSHLDSLLSGADATAAAIVPRRLVCGGEALSATLVRRIRAVAPQCRLFNHYGPTETTVGVIAQQVAEERSERARIPLGRPLANTRCYVLNAAMRPLPVGVPGELFIGGAQVARGYLRRPGLTASRFVPDPFAHEPGQRLYRTGDLVQWREDGTIDYRGRLDAQVKIRGYRVEPAEAERALARLPGVRDARVIVRNDETGAKQLAAYVVSETGPDVLREELRRLLPEYLVPATIVTLDRLPLTPNGKLDARALPAPPRPDADEPDAEPRTHVEEMLAGIWREVLRRDRVRRHDNFFSLNGDSLRAIRVISRVRDVFGVELPVVMLFESPTVAALADRIEQLRSAGRAALPAVTRGARPSVIPLSFAQERLWFLERLQPGTAFYNMTRVLRLDGPLDVAALQHALAEVVRRHDALRTHIEELAGVPRQVIADAPMPPTWRVPLAVEDRSALSKLPAAALAAEVDRLARDEAAAPFALTRGPLYRVRLVRLAAASHLLLTSVHHAISDGWSQEVFFRELWTLYAAYREGRTSPLAALPVQYADYTVWQRQQLRGEVVAREVAWWQARLAGAPTLMALPTDYPRPAVQTFDGASVQMVVSGTSPAALRELASRTGTTLSMVLLAAVQVLLTRYSGSPDVVVGTPVAGRPRPEVEGLIGLFLNTLVLRTDLGGDPTVRELLGRVRETLLSAFDHQELPFEQLVAALQPTRSLSHAPLFHVLFAVEESADGDAPVVPGLKIDRLAIESETTKFDLMFGFEARETALRIRLTYNTALFERATIERMATHLETVLTQIVAEPERRLSAVEVMEPVERVRVVETWNQTQRDWPAEATIATLVEAQAAVHPTAVAVIAGATRLTYDELNARANQLARYLRRLGVGPETRVAVCLRRDVPLVVGLLAVLKAGGAYVPLDPRYPQERLAFMLRDSGARVVVTEAAMREEAPLASAFSSGLSSVLSSVPSSDMTVVAIDDGATAAAIAAERTENVASGATARHLAYVIYTSGSTGRPKGVAIEHRSAVALLSWAASVYSAEELAGTLASTSICFDLSVFELFAPLSRGGCVILVDSPLELAASAIANDVRLINTVPAVMQELLTVGAIPASVTTVNLAGEPLKPELVDALYARGGITRVYDLYGPSEDTTYSTFALRTAGGRATIGAPISNTRAYVLDDRKQVAPIGVPGELYLGGEGLARGYLGRAALTAERFVPDAFGVEPGGRLYRTGDRVRWRADGTLEFLGRIDRQIKLRGFRIEPGEVEAALTSDPAIRAARAIVRTDASTGPRLVAYVVGDGIGIDMARLRARLRQSLPDYMMPAAIVPLAALPLTPSGKIDVQALPPPDDTVGTPSSLPRTPAEEQLAEIWRSVLGVDRPIDINENFFTLGGHSLLIMRVLARVRELFEIDLPVRVMFECPTVAELAERIEQIGSRDRPVLPAVTRGVRPSVVPLSFAQERLWFLERLQPGTAFYNISRALRLDGSLDVGALQRALSEIVRRHEALRTHIEEVADVPRQVIDAVAEVRLRVEDRSALSMLPAAACDAEVARLAREEAATPFALTRGPLYRVRLVRLDATTHVLLVSVHHAIGDGWSLDVFFRELWTLYAAYREGRRSPFVDLPVQYADYAVWQRRQLRGEVVAREVAWWQARLAGAPALMALPTDRARPAVQTFDGASVRLTLAGESLAALRALAHETGTTLSMVLLAAVQVLLAKHTGHPDVIVGTPVAGRPRPEVEGLIGLFLNTLVLRTDLGGDPTVRELLARVRETLLSAFDHQEVPFEQLVAALQPTRSLSHAPLFHVLFAVEESAGGDAPVMSDLRVERLAIESETTKFDLMFGFEAREAALRIKLTYNTALFERATIERMGTHLDAVLTQIAADPARRLSAIAVMGPAERTQVIETWNQTRRDWPAEAAAAVRDGAHASAQPAAVTEHQIWSGEATVAALVEAHAAARPTSVAVIAGAACETYDALNACANQLARYLRRQGVGPENEARVAVCLTRGVPLVVGLLAVLKAGGAYVPLDPRYPQDRLAFMLRDSGARVVVTEAALREQLQLPLSAGTDATVVTIDDETTAAAIAAESTDNVASNVTARRLAYVIYTSGSTGRPKGVGVEQGALVNLLATMREAPGLTRTDVLLAVTTVSFDIAGLELFLPLTTGAAVAIAPREASGDPMLLQQEMAATRATVLQATPATWRLLVDSGWRGDARLKALCGGEALAPDLAADLLPRCGELWNVYGPTETTIWSTCERIRSPESVTIGRPVANTHVVIVDAHGAPQPIGVAGELLIGGAGVARGYLGRPALTAERFVPDAFGAEPGGRLYRTGDRARWRADGTLIYEGRLDRQVKIRGFRIEPGEVEAALLKDAAVRAARVIVRHDPPGEPRLVAYVAGDAAGPNALDPARLRAALRERLPEYLVPAAIVRSTRCRSRRPARSM